MAGLDVVENMLDKSKGKPGSPARVLAYCSSKMPIKIFNIISNRQTLKEKKEF